MEKKTSPAAKQGQSNKHNHFNAAQRQRLQAKVRGSNIMILSTVNICYLKNGCKLVKDRTADTHAFSLRAFKNNQWEIINQWDDPGHVANLLVQSGVESEIGSAIAMLNKL